MEWGRVGIDRREDQAWEGRTCQMLTSLPGPDLSALVNVDVHQQYHCCRSMLIHGSSGGLLRWKRLRISFLWWCLCMQTSMQDTEENIFEPLHCCTGSCGGLCYRKDNNRDNKRCVRGNALTHTMHVLRNRTKDKMRCGGYSDIPCWTEYFFPLNAALFWYQSFIMDKNYVLMLISTFFFSFFIPNVKLNIFHVLFFNF